MFPCESSWPWIRPSTSSSVIFSPKEVNMWRNSALEMKPLPSWKQKNGYYTVFIILITILMVNRIALILNKIYCTFPLNKNASSCSILYKNIWMTFWHTELTFHVHILYKLFLILILDLPYRNAWVLQRNPQQCQSFSSVRQRAKWAEMSRKTLCFRSCWSAPNAWPRLRSGFDPRLGSPRRLDWP